MRKYYITKKYIYMNMMIITIMIISIIVLNYLFFKGVYNRNIYLIYQITLLLGIIGYITNIYIKSKIFFILEKENLKYYKNNVIKLETNIKKAKVEYIKINARVEYKYILVIKEKQKEHQIHCNHIDAEQFFEDLKNC